MLPIPIRALIYLSLLRVLIISVNQPKSQFILKVLGVLEILPFLDWASPVSQSVKNSLAMQEIACNAGDPGSISESGKRPRERNGNPLQYSRLGNNKDRGAWMATDCGVARVRHDLVTKPPAAAPFLDYTCAVS